MRPPEADPKARIQWNRGASSGRCSPLRTTELSPAGPPCSELSHLGFSSLKVTCSGSGDNLMHEQTLCRVSDGHSEKPSQSTKVVKLRFNTTDSEIQLREQQRKGKTASGLKTVVRFTVFVLSFCFVLFLFLQEGQADVEGRKLSLVFGPPAFSHCVPNSYSWGNLGCIPG